MYETDLSPLLPTGGELRAVRIENIGDEPSGSRGEDGGSRRRKQKKEDGKESFAQTASEVSKAAGAHQAGASIRVDSDPASGHENGKNESPLINDRRHIDVKA